MSVWTGASTSVLMSHGWANCCENTYQLSLPL